MGISSQMALKIEQYRADSGKLFDNEPDALRDDLHNMLRVELNEGSAHNVVRLIATNLDTFANIINELRAADDKPFKPRAVI